MQAEQDRPWAKRLLSTWGWLVGLTLLSLTVVLTAGTLESGWLAALTASVLSYVKARLLLDHFLDLRQSPPAWRLFFHGMIAAILALVLLGYGIPMVLS